MESKARFGFSLASLGDLDLDGFGDLAVGAPYGGLEGEGKIFVYRGGPKGIWESPSQVISGQEVNPGIRGFGFSISGAVDLDGNQYPDLIVGAPYSGHTIYFRSGDRRRTKISPS